MKALWKSMNNALQFRDIDEPIITEPDDVKIKVSGCTIGLDDLRMKREGDVYAQSGIAGYEMVGVITELGEQAAHEGFFVGQRVSGTIVLFCGQCRYCRQGKQKYCVSSKLSSGTLAEYIVWKSKQLVQVDDSLSDCEACLIEPVATMLSAMERLQIPLGSSVCILGANFCGLVMACPWSNRPM